MILREISRHIMARIQELDELIDAHTEAGGSVSLDPETDKLVTERARLWDGYSDLNKASDYRATALRHIADSQHHESISKAQ